jgi:hypothetical protein
MSRMSLWFRAGMASFGLVASAAYAQAASVPPTAGTYNAEAVYTAVTPTGGATDCPTPGSDFSFVFVYPGPAKAGAMTYQSQIKSGSSGINKILFPKTPAVGVTAWSGTATLENSLSATTGTAKFSATLQFFDANSFAAMFTFDEKVASGGSCDETILLTFIKL